MTTYTKINIDGTDYLTCISSYVKKSVSNFNSTSSFEIELDNYKGDYNNTFSLNEEVIIYADVDTNPATTKIFTGIIEDIRYSGNELREILKISGRDYGAILQDILVSPRIFKNTEVSSIVESLLVQNATGRGLTWTNINSTLTTIDRITFNNISLFDALQKLAEVAGFYFYVDVDKDVHFEEKSQVSSGLTFNNTNVTKAEFRTSDDDIFNYIVVYGDRQLTGARETFSSPTTGSTYILDDKPSNVFVIGSGTIPTYLQPGGIIYVNDPATEDVKWLVDYQSKAVILTSGTTAGDNSGWIGSDIIIDYQRSSPIIAIRQDTTSQTNYGKKDKIVVDRNIKELLEANLRANTLLADLKDPKTEGNISIYGIVDVTPGNTCVVDIPFHNINSQTYDILQANYNFNKQNCLNDECLNLKLNKKIKNFYDYTKEIELRLRNLEGAEVDTSITNIVTGTGSIVMGGSFVVVQRSIGSAFYFGVSGHDILNHPGALLGDVRAGSSIIEGSY